MLDYALHALSLGYCVMPATEDGSKQPLGNSMSDRRWKSYQQTLPTQAKVKEWYSGKLQNIGFVTGLVSGGLEVMDFDDSDAYHEYKSAAVSCGLGALVSKIETGYLEHSPRGVHWFYRCAEISGNLKLASRPKTAEERTHERDKVQVMIETRGEGGFIIAAPSRGPVNPKGEYRIISGSLDTVAIISPEDRRELHHLALSFDRMPKTIEYAKVNSWGDTGIELSPGDDFSERTSWEAILEPHGWKRCFGRGNEEFWTRPGKERGISATTNYADSGLFYVFSSSTEFEPERGFNKFAVYTYLNHHGDFEAAATALGGDGFGSKPEDKFIEERPLKIKNKKTTEQAADVDPCAIPPALMDIPGLVNDMQAWINACAIRRQPIFAFAASLAFAGLLMGRKVQSQTGLRTNLLIISLGDSAAGKNEARNCIRKALYETDNQHLIGAETIGSESGLLDELVKQGGHVIYQLDEIGHALMAMTSKKAQGWLSAVIPTLMKLQSSAGQTWIGKSLKQTKDNTGRADIEDPIVCVYATSVPGKYYQSIDYSNIEDGFVPRFLIFETNDPFPLTNYNRETGSLPDNIREHVEIWTHTTRRGMVRRPSTDGARVVRHTTDSMHVMRHFETMVQKEYKANKEKRLHAVWGRAQATAEQLALLFTCSQNPEADFIDPIMCMKAVTLTEYLCKQQITRLDGNISSNEHESQVKSVLRTIEGCKEGISRSDLVRRHQDIGSKTLSDITAKLSESNQIIIAKVKNEGSQKPSTMYISTKYAEVEK